MEQFLNIFSTPAFAADVIGTIQPPASVVTNTADVGRFISVLFSAIVVIAGLWALLQFILGGLGYVTSGGDAKKVQESLHKITYSIIGLVIIAASFIIIAILSAILFGNPTFLLNPQFQTL